MIYGDRVRLRAVEETDLSRYVVWLNDSQIQENLDQVLPFNNASEKAWFDNQQKLPLYERSLAIDILQEEEWIHAGGGGLMNFDIRAHQAELGIFIGAQQFRGHGFGTEVTQVLMRHGFETLNLHRIYLRVYEYNERACHVYQKVGFVEEGRLRDDRYYNGHYSDTIMMSILRSDWDVQQQNRG